MTKPAPEREFRTASHLPRERLYGPESLARRRGHRPARRLPVHPRACTPAATAGGCGRCGSTPASAPPPSRTAATATCSSRARPGSPWPSTCPRRSATTPTTRTRSARWARWGWRSTASRTWRRSSTRIPLDRVSTSMTINATAAILLALYVARGAAAGDPGGGALGHGAERHPQGVRGARDLDLPARAVDAAGHRPLRLLRGARAEVEHDLDLRLPHPRGGGDGAPGARLHLRERARVRARGEGGRARSRPLRRAAVVLLRLPLRLPRGGGEVPLRAAAVGAAHEGALRRHEPEGAAVPLPRPDGRRDPHRPAAGQQRGARGAAGARRRPRRLPEPAHERARRGPRPAHRGLGPARAAHPAGGGLRVGRRRHRGPARRQLRGRGGDRRAREGGAAAHRPDRGARRGARRHRAGRRPARDPGVGLPLPAAGRVGRARDRRRQPLPGGGGGAARRHPPHRRRGRAGPGGAGAGAARAARPRPWQAALDALEAKARTGENLVPAMVDAVLAWATVGEIASRLRGVFGEHRETLVL